MAEAQAKTEPERSFYEATTPERRAQEIAALPASLREFVNLQFSVRAKVGGDDLAFPALAMEIEHGDLKVDASIDLALLAANYDHNGMPGVIAFITAEIAAFWEGIQYHRTGSI